MKNYNEIMTMDDLGRVRIPKKVRQEFGFETGDCFQIQAKGREILLIKIEDNGNGR